VTVRIDGISSTSDGLADIDDEFHEAGDRDRPIGRSKCLISIIPFITKTINKRRN
jgi:hypothetical protein